MPHCIVEYARSLEGQLTPQAMVDAVHRGARASGLFEEADIKTRAIAYEHYRTGTAMLDFIHVTARILSGRSQPQRAALADLILAELQQRVPSPVSLTVEVCEIERQSYAKSVTGQAGCAGHG